MEKYRRHLVIPFLAPALIMIAVFFVIPAVMTLHLSLTDWYGTFKSTEWVGLKNYENLLSDSLFAGAVKNTFIYFGLALVLLFPLALFLGWALSRIKKGRSFFQLVIFAPAVLSVAVAGVLWKFILNPNFGLVNEMLRAIGLDALARPWLGDTKTAMSAIVVTIVWHGVATWVILIMAGMDRIPPELSEAAKLDGASEWQVYRHVTLPLLWPVLSTLLVLLFIQATQAFAFIYVMTQGGPHGATEVMGTYLYKIAFEGRKFSSGAAMAVVMTVIVLVVSIIGSRALRRDDVTM